MRSGRLRLSYLVGLILCASGLGTPAGVVSAQSSAAQSSIESRALHYADLSYGPDAYRETNGFQARTSLPDGTPPKIYIAITGTQPLKDWGADLKADLALAIDGVPNSFSDQVASAKRYVDDQIAKARAEHPDAEIVLTGHSLGGAIVQALNVEYPEYRKYQAFTWNAPGVKWYYALLGQIYLEAGNPDAAERIAAYFRYDGANITNYFMGDNPKAHLRIFDDLDAIDVLGWDFVQNFPLGRFGESYSCPGEGHGAAVMIDYGAAHGGFQSCLERRFIPEPVVRTANLIIEGGFDVARMWSTTQAAIESANQYLQSDRGWSACALSAASMSATHAVSTPIVFGADARTSCGNDVRGPGTLDASFSPLPQGSGSGVFGGPLVGGIRVQPFFGGGINSAPEVRARDLEVSNQVGGTVTTIAPAGSDASTRIGSTTDGARGTVSGNYNTHVQGSVINRGGDLEINPVQGKCETVRDGQCCITVHRNLCVIRRYKLDRTASSCRSGYTKSNRDCYMYSDKQHSLGR